MIISKTPLRISFFGGGTDYRPWFREHGGAVLSTSIDKYCYHTCRFLPPFFEHKFRVSYSQIELVQSTAEIEHPSVRACLEFMKITEGVEIHYDGDLPARTGLGSSSAFTVGLLRCLHALKGEMIGTYELGQEAIHVEQNLIKENVGCQDQMAAALGGFNLMEFGPGDRMQVQPFFMPANRQKVLNNHLMLFFTGFVRNASEIAADVIQGAQKKQDDMRTIHQMVQEAVKILSRKEDDIRDFGKLLHEGWKLKRGLSSRIATPVVDEIYDTAMKAGALGGKLLGAGGGGFMLIFAEPERQPKIRTALRKFLHVPFSFETDGNRIIYYKVDEYDGWEPEFEENAGKFVRSKSFEEKK